jgi:hypothetical protein
MPLVKAASYERPFAYVAENIKPIRAENKRGAYANKWWLYAESRPAMRRAFSPHARFLATCMVAKHRMFVWLDPVSLPGNVVIAFGRSDNYFLGVLQSKFHEVWALKQGTRLETRPRYTPTTCFETFPFPFDLKSEPSPPLPTPPALESGKKSVNPDQAWVDAEKFYSFKEEPSSYRVPGNISHRIAIATAANELNEFRERWLNPPEWTETRTLEFPGSITGPWARYVEKPDKNGIGKVLYPRLEPRDADCAAKLKDRTLTNLYNERPAWLDLAHKKLDAAVAAAYGWPDNLTDEQILEKLLALNSERAEEEAKLAKGRAPKPQRQKDENELV